MATKTSSRIRTASVGKDRRPVPTGTHLDAGGVQEAEWNVTKGVSVTVYEPPASHPMAGLAFILTEDVSGLISLHWRGSVKRVWHFIDSHRDLLTLTQVYESWKVIYGKVAELDRKDGVGRRIQR